MKPFKHILSIAVAGALLLSITAGATAAKIEDAPSSAPLDIGIVAADYEEVGSVLEPKQSLPSYYSSKDLGYTTSVLSQQYNTCWVYSNNAALESLIIKNGGEIDHLSHAHMNYWATPDSNNKGWLRTYTAGGYPYISIGYLTSWTGAYEEAAFPQSTPYETFDRSASLEGTHYGVNSLIYLYGTDKDTVKTAVMNYGGVVASFHLNRADHLVGSSYYCNVKGLSTSQLFGHSIDIVGWDDDYDRFNFSKNNPDVDQEDPDIPIEEKKLHTPEQNGAWLCKNSWGDTFADNGYFWISYEDEYLFDSRFGPCYAITDYQMVDENVKLYQNEIYGANCTFDYVSQIRPRMSRLTYANVFNFSDFMTVLDKIVFETKNTGSRYTLYYIPVSSDFVPVSDSSRWITLSEGVVDYEGYVCVDIEDLEIPEGRGAVAVEFQKTQQSELIGIGANEWITAGGRYIFLPESQRGQSYILGFDAEATDVMDFYKDHLNDDIGGTFVIKAITKKSEIGYGDVDRDGAVTILDASHIQKSLALLETFDEEQIQKADYDFDERMTILDATRIQRKLANLI